MIFAPAYRSDKTEILDSPDCNYEELKANLRDIARFNSFLHTRDAILNFVKLIIKKNKISGKVRILDLCSGSADIPVYIVDWSRKQNIETEITAIDLNQDIVNIAREEAKSYPEIIAEARDAFNLPYQAASFNIVMCSQAFHHFSDRDCLKLLKIMDELSSDGIIVNDLRRNWINYFFAHLLSRIWNMHYMSINDAPISILRAFTRPEFEKMASDSGIKGLKCYPYFVHSLQLVSIK